MTSSRLLEPANNDPVGDSAERVLLRASVRAMVDRVSPPSRILELDEAEQFDHALFRALADAGFLGIDTPGQEGSGDVRDQSAVIEELAAGPTSMQSRLRCRGCS